MQYKQFLFSAAIGLTAITTSQAQYRQDAADEYQQRFYVKAGIQYGTPVMGSLGFKGDIVNSATTYFVDSSLHKTSFGGGVWANINLGYFITPNLGIDAGVSAGLVSQKQVVRRDELPYRESTSTIVADRPIVITPSIIYRVPFDRFGITGKVGVVVPFHTNLKQTDNTFYPSRRPGEPDYSYEFQYEIRNRFGLGFSCGLGAEYRLTDHIALALDLNVTSLSIDTKEKEMTSYIDNGIDAIDQIPKERRITHYEYEVKGTDPITQTTRSPISMPFSNANARLGFVIYF